MGSEQLSTLTDRTVVSRVIRLAIGMAAAGQGASVVPPAPHPRLPAATTCPATGVERSPYWTCSSADRGRRRP